jgi:voltage-gated sodium channel
MNKFLYNLKESRIFQFVVISIIILNAITIGVNTYDLSDLPNKQLII